MAIKKFDKLSILFKVNPPEQEKLSGSLTGLLYTDLNVLQDVEQY